MAVNKDSKAYKWLLEKGYTDEQIMQMHDELASGQSAKTVTENWQRVSGWLDPMSDLNPEYIANMDMNKEIKGANQSFSQYWDDSSRDKQDTMGWLNQKYTWEWVKNSDVNYDENLRLQDLNPNFVYGKQSQVYGTDHPGYISQRNDQIASALYNEWKTSREDVANFLLSQNWFMNSSEADRLNTIESVWKRLWAIAEQNTPEEQPDLSKADEIVKDTSGKLYGKVTAEEWNPEQWIDTLADANSAFKAIAERRNQTVNDMYNMWVDNLASIKYYWDGQFSEQAWRDFWLTYPQTSALVDQKVKEMKWQEAVNAISNWKTSYMESDIDSKKRAEEWNKEAMANQYSSSEEETAVIKQQIEDSVATNQTASEASRTMSNIESEVARLKNRLKNLREEANSKFKWDVPDYIVNAYMNNRTQEIQNQLSILEDRYNAAYQRYTTELDNSWKQKNYDLQVRQIENQEKQQSFNEWYQKQTLNKSNIYTDKNGASWELKEWADWTLYYEKIEQITQYADSGMKGKWLKNNNPWNIKDNDFWNVIWHDDSWFAIFATPEDWFDALVEKIIFNQTNPNSRYYGTTLREYFRIYAPSSDWNNPDAYAKSVAKQLWVSVDTPIKDIDPVALAEQIAKHDSGYNYSTYWQFRWWTNSKNIDVNNIKIPDSIYIKDTWYATVKVDPDSEEWKKLKQQYIDNYLKENWLSAKTENSNVPMTTVTLDSGESYQIPTSYYRYIYGPIPSRQKDSDLDNQRILEQILDLYNNWLSVTDALLTFNGINLNSDYADMARTLFWYVMASGKDPAEWLNSSIAYNLTNGNDWLAVSAVENFVLPDEQKKEIVRITALAEKISDFIERTNDPDYTKYFWPFDSPINTWFWKKAGNDKAIKAYADLWNIYADIRQNLLGSQITEHEAEIYEPILANSSENLNTVIQKLQSTLQWQMATYNAIRGQYWLPRLNLYSEDLMDQVLYPESRVALYSDNNY